MTTTERAPAKARTNPKLRSPGPKRAAAKNVVKPIQQPPLAAPILPDGQTGRAPQGTHAVGGQAARDGHPPSESQSSPAVPGPFLRNPLLRLAADVVDDLERVRNANQNRLRQLTRVGPDADGEHRGFEMPEDHPDVKGMAALVASLELNYEASVKNLERLMKQHPLWQWAEPLSGIGAKQFARLLGAIGDPYWHDGEDRPRGLYELFAYCGLDPVNGVGRRRRRGELCSWNDTAKMRAYLIAESCMKQIAQPERTVMIKGVPRLYAAKDASPYRDVYDTARAQYEGATHDVEPCPQCGAKGKPAPVGSPLRDGHVNQRALRKVAKQILKDLWCEAERLHKQQPAARRVVNPKERPPLSAKTPGTAKQQANPKGRLSFPAKKEIRRSA